MKNYKSAMGKSIDMSALAARNEHTRAVGNMSVNARGDTIDSIGRVIRPVTDKVNEAYGKTVGNKSAQVKRTVTPKPVTQKVEAVKPKVEELTESELELEESLEDDIEVGDDSTVPDDADDIDDVDESLRCTP
jgi:hypothetical protein